MPKSRVRKKRKENDLFLSEKVLAESPIAVQELLQGAKSKSDYHVINSSVHQKPSHHTISDAKKKAKIKQLFNLIWPDSRGAAMRIKNGYTELAK